MSIRESLEIFVDREMTRGSLISIPLRLLRNTGITPFIRKKMIYRQYKQESIHPTEAMLSSKEYFKAHITELNEILSRFADEESRQTYKRLIRFRYTHNTGIFPNYCIKNQYFVKDFILPDKDWVFIDCGSFTGDTADAFIRYCSGNYKRIVCFEPDQANYDALLCKFQDNDKLIAIKAGVWDSDTQLSFCDSLGMGSKISNDNAPSENVTVIDVKSIDSTEACREASYIKMDIEGAEYNALLGAKQTILKNRPILAISIYHSDEDMIRLPKWIMDLGLDYDYYVRQHSFDEHDTVFYAVPKTNTQE